MRKTAKFRGTCLRCQGRISPGEAIEWQSGVGASHVECPSPQQQLQIGREARWRKVDDNVWCVRVTDPAGGCHALAGQEIEVESAKGRVQKVTLAERLDGATQRDCTYAVVKEALPGEALVPAGRYALEEPGQRYVLIRVWRKGERVNVFDARTREKVPDVKATLERIVAAGAAASAVLYGKVTGECSRCGEQLSVRLSIELGIGPVCGKHWHDPEQWRDRKAAARAALRARGLDPNEQVVVDAAEAA